MAARTPKNGRAAPSQPSVRPATASELEHAAGTALTFIRNPDVASTPDGEARIAGFLVHALVSELPAADAPRLSVIDVVVGTYSADDIARMRELTPFDLPSIVRELPAKLSALPAETPVRVRRSGFDSLSTAGAVVDEMRATAERQRCGRFTISECAALLQEATAAARGRPPRPGGEGTEAYWQQLMAAAATGALTVIDPLTLLRSSVDEWPGASSAQLLVERSELAAWLVREKHSLRLPDEPHDEPVKAAPGIAGAPTVQAGAPAPCPVETEAIRQQRRHDAFLSSNVGGKLIERSGKTECRGKRGALKLLADQERAAGRPYSDARRVAEDIKAEAARRLAALKLRLPR